MKNYLDDEDRRRTDTEGLILRQQELIQRLSLTGQENSSAKRFLIALLERLKRLRTRATR